MSVYLAHSSEDASLCLHQGSRWIELSNDSVFEHKDPVIVHNRVEAVGDGDDCAEMDNTVSRYNWFTNVDLTIRQTRI